MTDKHERYMIDNCGTLIDKKTCTCYDYLEEILPTLNQQENQLKPIKEICTKYNIPLEDLPEVLEEYITLDNEEYEEKLRERTI